MRSALRFPRGRRDGGAEMVAVYRSRRLTLGGIQAGTA